ncbi:NAD-dependent epimerase/dehydratase family protein [Magnetovibrio sp.]|uniref:NAD-dependent epimerase/dehydratase family protein n=1 Tax=Magnetovibrio sp. TaxID=2024836 RepID=UPI002F93A53F
MVEERPRVGVLGATSLVGRHVSSRLVQMGYNVSAFSRQADVPSTDGVEWVRLDAPGEELRTTTSGSDSHRSQTIELWICVMSLWLLPEHLPLLEARGARRIVALSSTSRFTKTDSADHEERETASRLADMEALVADWARARDVEWIVLRPTLIYGLEEDKNIAVMTRFIRRFGFFPVLGEARGLRQPIHADDVAAACVSALSTTAIKDRAYNLSGGETLTYREMVARLFTSMGKPARIISVPLWAFRLGVMLAHLIPRYRHWSPAMATRMNSDLVFDHAEARDDFGFAPRPFQLDPPRT